MSSLVIVVKSPQTRAELVQLYQKPSSAPKEEAIAIRELLHAVAGGIKPVALDVHASATDPVAASSTYTLASVIATDTATVGKTVFTFTASPTTSLHVETDVGSAKAFASSTDISILNGEITESSHGYVTGDVGQLTTSSALPTGFSLSTDYHVIKISANVYKLASSQANAVAGIPIVPSAVGTCNQTITPSADKCLAYRLMAAINAHADTSQIVVATAAAAVVTVTAAAKGIIGNHIVAASAGGTITVTGSGYLSGGTGGVTEAAVHYSLGIA